MINNNGLTNEEVIINRRKYGSNTFNRFPHNTKLYKLMTIKLG